MGSPRAACAWKHSLASPRDRRLAALPPRAEQHQCSGGFGGRIARRPGGRTIGILRYGRSFEKAAPYEQQFGAHFLLYEPRIMTGLKNEPRSATVN